MAVTVDNISMRYESAEVFSGFSASFRDGAVSCLIGPSGCGKSTLLNILAGLAEPSSGSVSGLSGRSVSYAFQEPRLLPWKSVEGNVDFVLDRSLPAAERSARVARWLDAVRLSDAASLWPSQLSGGMARRASLARTFVTEADILLLDEPFSGIDMAVKRSMMKDLKDLWTASGTTVIMVTHDVDEALAVGDEVFVLSRHPVRLLLQESVSGDLDSLRAGILALL